jgi:hypothetical protein
LVTKQKQKQKISLALHIFFLVPRCSQQPLRMPTKIQNHKYNIQYSTFIYQSLNLSLHFLSLSHIFWATKHDHNKITKKRRRNQQVGKLIIIEVVEAHTHNAFHTIWPRGLPINTPHVAHQE